MAKLLAGDDDGGGRVERKREVHRLAELYMD